MVFDFDDFGANHVISDQCQSHDCRDALLMLKEANPAFKVTLFAIPDYMTPELLRWAHFNSSWVELAVHGFGHSSNYECEKMTYQDFGDWMEHTSIRHTIRRFGTKGFKAPGWQISDDAYRWLKDNGWWVADQEYNTARRPDELRAYVNNNGKFYSWTGPNTYTEREAWHGHTWDCVGNGIYETLPQLLEMVQGVKEFQFVSEVLK